ncbi:MAG: short chain dehydrogenase [Alphaproteobacteria bacterium]|nr:MAG: short chain dehydrogenase [Caulobacteraceae bacterium]TPW07335.1 MAG: short chain dehydrogenase [Alphaproteobacteria bacterium]
MAGRVQGKKAFITGGAQGLGEAIARMFARDGASVTVSDLNISKARDVAESINASGGKAFAYEHDVTDAARWEAVLQEAAADMGGLNILVNNAGIASAGSVETETLDGWKRVMDIDLDSVFLGCRFAMPVIRESGIPGSIVNISSIAGLIAAHNSAAYNAAKAGVWMLSKSVALHGARMTPQIRCNSVHPVFIDTPILDVFKKQIGEQAVHDKLSRQVPMGRIGEPDDVAYMVLYLASDEAKFVTGAEFKVDGGISAM